MSVWRNWPSMTSRPYRHSWADLPEDLPVDVLPWSSTIGGPAPCTS